MLQLTLKRDAREKRLRDRKKQLSSAAVRSSESSWAAANSKAVYHQEAEQRRRDGVKHGASAKDLVADALREAGSISELVAVLQAHKKRLTALHASCALGTLYNLMFVQPEDPAPQQSLIESVLAVADTCLEKAGHKLSAISLPAVVFRYSRLGQHNPAVLAKLCQRAAQLLDELDPEQLSKLTWALGTQVQLAQQQHTTAVATMTAAAGAQTASAPSSKASSARSSGATPDPQPAPDGSSGAAGSSSASCKATSSKLAKDAYASDPCAELLPALLDALSTSLPSMKSRSLADTAVGLLDLMPHGVPVQVPEAQVLQLCEIVADIVQRRPRDD